MSQDAPHVTVAIKQIGNAKSEPLDLTDRFRLVSFSYDDNAKLVDELTFTLDNWDLALFDDPLFRLKNEVDVSWGYQGDMTEIRRCVIVEISGGQLLSIKAHGQAVWMDGERKSRRWASMSRSDVVRKVAAEYGFGTDAYVEDTKVIYPQITQARCTDAQFIRHLADQEGFEFSISRGQLHFHRAKFDQQPVKTLVWTGKTNASNPNCSFVTFPTISEEVKGKVGAMAHKGLDPMAKKAITVKQSNATHTGPTLGTALSVSAKERDDDAIKGAQKIGVPLQVKSSPEATSATTAPTEAAAKRESDAKYHKSRKGLLKMSCSIVGDKNVGARDLVTVEGIGSRLSGKWYIEKANHKPVGTGPYIVSLECTRDAHFGWADPKRDVKAKGALNKKEVPKDDDGTEEWNPINKKTEESARAFRPRH